VAAASGALADVCLRDGDAVRFGGRGLRALSTPGHTAGCMSFLLDDGSAVFTGDALLVRGCGRTDFQGGSARALFASVRGALLALPRATRVFPGHDYNGHAATTVGEEADLNPRLGVGRSPEEFEAIMHALALARPALIDVAVPANLRDGVLAGAPPAPGITPPAGCVPCRQDGEAGEPAVPIVW
jgi:sulfur dioxygenase